MATPADLSSKVLWLRASDLAGSSGAAITSWADQSGAGHSLTSSTRSPTVATASTPAGGKSARFDKSTLPVPPLGLTADGEMWLVVKSDNLTDAAAPSWKFGTQIGGDVHNYHGYAGVIYEDFGSTVRRSFTPTASLGAWRLYRVAIDSTRWFVEIDNVLQSQALGATRAWIATPSLSGPRAPSDGAPISGLDGYMGNIAEVLIRSTVSTSGEVADLITYFNTQHGLSVPGGSVSTTKSGSGTGAFQWAGTATGKRDPKATGTGTFTWTGVASGSRASRATGSGSFAWTGTAVGTAPTVGAAEGTGAGSFSWAGTAVGKRAPKAVGSGAFTWHGTAVGSVPGEVTSSDLRAPVLTDARIVSAESQGTVVELDTWLAKVETDARMRLPLVVTAPPAGVLTQWPIERQAHLMAALSAANPRYRPYIDYTIDRGEVGRLHAFVGHRDVTYLRGVPAEFSDFSSSVPMGPASATISLPQMKPWDQSGAGDFSMFAADAPVEIALVRPDDSVEQVWEGFLSAEDDSSGEGREDYQFHAEGLFAQAMHEPWDPPVFMDPIDPGHLLADILNAVPGRRWNKIPQVSTGLPSVTDRGSQGQSFWQHAQDVLSQMIADDGRQWTLRRVAPYTYRIVLKPVVAATTFTVTKGAPGVEVSLTTDQSTRRDAIYGRGYAPGGGYWCGRVFPNLRNEGIPRYPMDNTSLNLDGRTDSGTSTGDGITLWQRQMRLMGYPVTVDGVMNPADAKWVLKVQTDRGLTRDSSLGPQTWAATFENNSTDADTTSYRRPLATLTEVEPWLYSANGARVSANPAYDKTVIRHAMPEVDFGSGIRKSDAIVLAKKMLLRDAEPAKVGRIVLQTDPHEAGTSRFDVKPGDNVRVVGHHDGANAYTDVQVSDVSVNDLEVTLTVDSKGRDFLLVEAILERNESARRDPSARTSRGTDQSSLNKASVVQFEEESDAGWVSRTAVNGDSGLWVIRKTFVSTVGVAKVEFEASSPKAELVVALFNRPVRTSVLASLVGNPLGSSDGWYDNVEKLQDTYGLMEVFGSPGNPGGYWPRQKGDGPLTGRLRDSSSSMYDSPFGGFVWVALFTSRSTWVEGRVFPGVPT